MDQSNYDNVVHLAQSADDRKKVQFLLDYLYPNQKAAVPDPYYGSLEDFEKVETSENYGTFFKLIKIEEGKVVPLN